jgi:predicted XRE-type DNA-binding protein
MSAYEVDIEKLKESEEIKDEKELLKLKLVAAFLKATSKMETEEILSLTRLHKSDLSRLRALNVSRFTIDRIVGFLDALGFSTNIDVKPKQAS